MLTGLAGAVGAALIMSPSAAADPPPPPPPVPNVNGYAPVSPVDYAAMDGAWYAFGAPGGVTCVLNRQAGGYGCSGPMPGAPGGANFVSAGPTGPPGFATTPAPVYGMVADPKPLEANTRLSYRSVSCGTDGVMTACVNSFDQTGFVISPAGSYIVGEPALLDRRSG